jgi:uncharacterized protein
VAELVVEGADLVLRLSKWERLGAVSGDLRFPRSAVADVSTCTPAFVGVRGIRIMGTGIPGKVVLGTRWVSGGVREFAAVYGRDPGAVLVDLMEQKYARLVVSAPDPERLAAAIR